MEAGTDGYCPQGVKDEPPLRDKIKAVQRDLDAGLISAGRDMTVLELVKKYVAQKTGVRENTRVSYQFVVNILKKEEFGSRRIDKVKLSDARL